MKLESRVFSITILFVFLITLLSTPSMFPVDVTDASSSSGDSSQLTIPRPGMLADYPDSYTRVEWEQDTVTTNWNYSDNPSYWEFGPSISWQTRNLTTGLLTEWNETIGLDVWVDFEVGMPFTSLTEEDPYAVVLQGAYFNMSEIESGPTGPEDEPGIALMALYIVSETRWDVYSSTNHSFGFPQSELPDNFTLQDVFGPPVDPFVELDNASSTYDEGEEAYWLTYRMRFNQSTTPGFYHFMAIAMDADMNPIGQSRGAALTGRAIAVSFDELIDQSTGGYYCWSRLDDDGNPVYSATRGQDFNMTAVIRPASFDNVTIFLDLPNQVLVQRMTIGEYPVRTMRTGGWEYDEDAGTYFWNASVEIEVVELVHGSYMAEEPTWFDAGVEVEYFDPKMGMMSTEYSWAQMAIVYWFANNSWSTLYSYEVPYYEWNPHWEDWDRFDRHVFEPWPIDGSIPKSYILNESESSYLVNTDGHHVVNFRGHISEEMMPTDGLGWDSLWVYEEVWGQDGRRLVAYPHLPMASPEDFSEYEQLKHMAVESPIAIVRLLHQGQEYHPSWMFQSDIGETFTVKSKLQGGAEYVDDVDGVGFFMFGWDDRWGFDGANDWWQHSQVEVQVRVDNDGDSEVTIYNHTTRTSWSVGEHYEWQYVEVFPGSGVWEWREVLVVGEYWQEQLWDFETESWTSIWFPMYSNKSIMDVSYLNVDAIIYELDGNDLRIWFDITPLAGMPHLEWEWDFFYGNLTWVTDYEEEWGEHTVLGWVEEPVYHYWNGTDIYVKQPVKHAAFRNNDTPAVYGRVKMPYIELEGANESVQMKIQSSPEGLITESVIFEEWDPEGYDEETGEYSGAWKYHLKLLNDTEIPIYDGRYITIFNITLWDGRWFESYHEWPEHMWWNGLDYMFAVNGTAIIGDGAFWAGMIVDVLDRLPATRAGLVVYANGTIPLYLATHPEWMFDHYVIHMNETWEPIDVWWNGFFGAYAYFNVSDNKWYVLWNDVHPFELYAATYGPHEVPVPHHWTYYYAYTTVSDTDYPLPAPEIPLMDLWDMDYKIPAQEFAILDGVPYEAVWIGDYFYDDGINPTYWYPAYQADDGVTLYNLTDYGYDPLFPWDYTMYGDLNGDLPWISKANGSLVIPEIFHHDWTIAYGHRNNETWELVVDGYLNVTTGFYKGDYMSSQVYDYEIIGDYNYVETEYGEIFYYNQSLRVLFFNVTLANGTFFYTASPFPEEAVQWNNDSQDWEVDHFYMYDIDGDFKNWTTWTDFTVEIVVVNKVTKKGAEDEFIFEGVPRNVTSFDYHYFDRQDYTWHSYARDTVDRDYFTFLQAMNVTYYEVIDLAQDYDRKYNFPSWNFTVDGFTWFNVTGRRDMIFKAHQVWGHSQKLDYKPLPITVQKDQWRIVTGIPEWGMWDLDTWTVNPDTGALDLDGDLETEDDQYYVKSTHSFQENFTMTEEYLWVDIFWEPNGSLFNDEFHMSSYTGKVTFSWEHSWADNHIWYYADTGTVVDASEWSQINDTLYDAWGNPKPGYWGISWMAENFTSDDLKQQALDEGWDWVEDGQTWSWLWWGLHEDYSTDISNGTHSELMHIDLDYEFAGVLAWNDTVAVDAATTNVMNFNSTYSELTHYWMPMDVEAVTFVTPGEAWGNMNQSDMEYRALNETIDFGVSFQNLTGVAFPYGDNSYFDWYDGQYYGSDLSTFAERPTECNTTELSLDVHFTGAENATGANSAEVKFDIAVGEWQVDTPDQDPLDGFSLAIAFYSELTVSTESGQSAEGGYVGDTGVPLNNTAAVPSENFTMTSGLSNVAMMSLGGSPYYWGSPEGGNVNVTAQTVPLSAFQSMYVSDEGTSNAATFNVSVEQFYTLISFRWWSGYEVEVDPVFVGYISPGATDTIAPSISSVQSIPREISGVDNMHLEINAYDAGGSGMNEVKVWDQVNNVNYTATYVSGIDAYVVNVPRQTGREEQYYFDYSIVANDGAGNELVASGYTFRFRDNMDPIIELMGHINGTDAFSNEIGIVEVQVFDPGGSGVSSVTLTYTNSTASYNVTMTLSGTNYTAIIPNHPPGSSVSYQVTVYDADGNYFQSSAQPFHFFIEGPDVTGPSLLSLGRQPTGPTSTEVVTISVTILDSAGVQSAILQYRVDTGAWVNITMSSAGDIYSANIPAQVAGASVTYRIVAYDTLGNIAISSEQSYEVQTETTTTTEPTEPVEPIPGPRPQDLSSTYMMLAGIGLTMIVILVMVFQRKRRL